jgi:tetratricopeptide (TPR) repeat protein
MKPARLVVVALAVLLSHSPVAGARETGDAEAARWHYDQGARLYEQGRWADAIREFETARGYRPSAAFDYNIARCHEHLEEWSLAADAYERYLAAKPRIDDAAELRSRIRKLRDRASLPAASASAPASASATAFAPASAPAFALAPAVALAAPRDAMPPLRMAAWSLLGAAVTTAVVGGGLVGSVGPDYDALRRYCSQRSCGPSDTAELRNRLYAGDALIAVGVAAAVADVALWIVDARRRHSAGRAFLTPTVGGMVAGGRF